MNLPKLTNTNPTQESFNFFLSPTTTPFDKPFVVKSLVKFDYLI